MAVFRFQGAWRAQVYIKGRCVASRAGFSTKTKAQDWHDETKQKRKAGPPPKTATFEELASRFEAWHLPTVGERTRELYLLDIRLRIRPYFQFVKLETVDEPMLEAFKAKVAGEVGAKTANNTLSLLGLMLGKAVRWKMLADNPYMLERLPEPAKPYQWWSEREDIGRFLAAAKRGRYYGLYLTALETGLRLGELLGLSKADLDFETGMIHVHRQWTAKECFSQTKSGKERWVSFNPEGQLARVLKEVAKASLHPEAVFTTRNGKRPRRNKVAMKYFHATIKRAGVPRIKFHDMRHTFASWYMREVGDIWALKSLLGHSAISTTQRYAHHAHKGRLPVLGLSERATHIPHILAEVRDITEKNERGKPWWGHTDLKRNTPALAS